jgi:hypothetical protein
MDAMVQPWLFGSRHRRITRTITLVQFGNAGSWRNPRGKLNALHGRQVLLTRLSRRQMPLRLAAA